MHSTQNAYHFFFPFLQQLEISGVTESELLDGLKSGNESAFRFLVEQHSSRVFNTCLGMIRNREDAEDIAQEVFVEAWQAIGEFRGDSKISTFLYRIAVNRCLDHLRYRKRKKRFAFLSSLFGEDSVQPRFEKGDFSHPGIIMENQERAAVLFRAIESLPESQQVAFTLCKIEGLSLNEAGEIMEKGSKAVESLLTRAKENLRKTLGNYYENNEK